MKAFSQRWAGPGYQPHFNFRVINSLIIEEERVAAAPIPNAPQHDLAWWARGGQPGCGRVVFLEPGPGEWGATWPGGQEAGRRMEAAVITAYLRCVVIAN